MSADGNNLGILYYVIGAFIGITMFGGPVFGVFEGTLILVALAVLFILFLIVAGICSWIKSCLQTATPTPDSPLKADYIRRHGHS